MENASRISNVFEINGYSGFVQLGHIWEVSQFGNVDVCVSVHVEILPVGQILHKTPHTFSLIQKLKNETYPSIVLSVSKATKQHC